MTCEEGNVRGGNPLLPTLASQLHTSKHRSHRPDRTSGLGSLLASQLHTFLIHDLTGQTGPGLEELEGALSCKYVAAEAIQTLNHIFQV